MVYLRNRLEIPALHRAAFSARASISLRPDIQSYYRDTLLPEYLPGQTAPPLEQVAPRIEEILLQQQVSAMFSGWLDNLRKQGEVEVLDPSLEAANAGGSGGRAGERRKETDDRNGDARARRRRWPWICAGSVGLLVLLAIVGGYFWLSSSSFENLVRAEAGGAAGDGGDGGGAWRSAPYHWSLMNLDASLVGLVIHGREAAHEAPYARVGDMHVRVSILNVFSPRILLRELVIRRPELHLIVYADGTTNQPQPKRASKPGKPMLDTLFDLKAGRVAVEQGRAGLRQTAHRTSTRRAGRLPLDFAARDVSAVLRYVPAAGHDPESYHIEAGARDSAPGARRCGASVAHAGRRLSAGHARPGTQCGVSALAARDGERQRDSRAVADDLGVGDELLAAATGKRPAQGELDMRLLEPITGYTNVPEGIARLDLNGEGNEGQFRLDGPLHVDGGAYVGGGVNAHGVNPGRARTRRCRAVAGCAGCGSAEAGRPARGRSGAGSLAGSAAGRGGDWSPATAAPAKKRGDGFSEAGKRPQLPHRPLRPPTLRSRSTARVTALFRDVTVDEVMDIVGQGPFQRLGLGARLNGPATATWTNGDTRTLAVDGKLRLNATVHTPTGESPATGMIDGTYTQRDGRGEPARPRDYDAIEQHSRTWAPGRVSNKQRDRDFDRPTLAEPGRLLMRCCATWVCGARARPEQRHCLHRWAGQAEFHGTWSNSLLDPHLAGTLTASNVSIELPGSTTGGSTDAAPR